MSREAKASELCVLIRRARMLPRERLWASMLLLRRALAIGTLIPWQTLQAEECCWIYPLKLGSNTPAELVETFGHLKQDM